MIPALKHNWICLSISGGMSKLFVAEKKYFIGWLALGNNGAKINKWNVRKRRYFPVWMPLSSLFFCLSKTMSLFTVWDYPERFEFNLNLWGTLLRISNHYPSTTIGAGCQAPSRECQFPWRPRHPSCSRPLPHGTSVQNPLTGAYHKLSLSVILSCALLPRFLFQFQCASNWNWYDSWHESSQTMW